MKNIKTLFKLIIVSILLSSCASKQADYYWHVNLNSNQEIVGVSPVEENLVPKIKCYHFKYNENEQLVSVEYLKYGKLSIDKSEESAPCDYNLEVAKIKIEYSKGFEEIKFFDDKDKPMFDASQIYSKRKKINEDNLPSSIYYYGQDGKIIVQDLLYLDDKGRVIKIIKLDEKGVRKLDALDWASEKRIKYDELGNPIEYSFYSKDGKLSCRENVSIYRYKYDKNGNKLEVKKFGINEKLIVFNNSNMAILRMKYDDSGFMTEEKHFGVDDILIDEGITESSIVQWKYDEFGNIIEQRYFGTNEQLKACKNGGFAILKSKRDKFGNYTEQKYFGTDEQLSDQNDMGCAIGRFKYNNKSEQIEERYYNTNNHLTLTKENNAAIVRKKFDEMGNMIEKNFYNTDDKRTGDKIGISSIRWEYNTIGNKLKVSFFGVDDLPIEDRIGVSIYQYTYDENGFPVNCYYLNKVGEILYVQNL